MKEFRLGLEQVENWFRTKLIFEVGPKWAAGSSGRAVGTRTSHFQIRAGHLATIHVQCAFDQYHILLLASKHLYSKIFNVSTLKKPPR